jgi:hypothetical protein
MQKTGVVNPAVFRLLSAIPYLERLSSYEPIPQIELTIMNIIEEIRPLLPFLIPVLIIQLGLMVAALLDLVKREQTRGPKWMWVVIIIFVNLIGPIIYFLLGREDV